MLIKRFYVLPARAILLGVIRHVGFKAVISVRRVCGSPGLKFDAYL